MPIDITEEMINVIINVPLLNQKLHLSPVQLTNNEMRMKEKRMKLTIKIAES